MWRHFGRPVEPRSEPPEQTSEPQSPADERDHDRPAARPVIVSADDLQAGYEQEQAIEIGDGSNVGFPDVKIQRLRG